MSRQVVGPMAGDAALAFLAQHPAQLFDQAGARLDRVVGDFLGPHQQQTRQIARPIVALAGVAIGRADAAHGSGCCGMTGRQCGARDIARCYGLAWDVSSGHRFGSAWVATKR